MERKKARRKKEKGVEVKKRRRKEEPRVDS
jgi:hypothetical protein